MARLCDDAIRLLIVARPWSEPAPEVTVIAKGRLLLSSIVAKLHTVRTKIRPANASDLSGGFQNSIYMGKLMVPRRGLEPPRPYGH